MTSCIGVKHGGVSRKYQPIEMCPRYKILSMQNYYVVITPCIAVILLATIIRISSIALVNLIIVSYVMRIASLSKHAMLPSMDGNAILSL